MKKLDIQKKACGVLLFKNQQVLLQLRDNKPNIVYPGTWAPPGGGVNKKESFKQGAIRELKEETDYSTTQLTQFYKSLFFTWDNKVGEVAYFLGIYDNKQQIKCLEGQKMEFINIKDLPKIRGNLFKPELERIIKHGYKIYKTLKV